MLKKIKRHWLALTLIAVAAAAGFTSSMSPESILTVFGIGGSPVGSDNPMPINSTFGVPNTFTKQTSSSRTFYIQKGSLNHHRQRPAIINEHVETARQIQGTLEASTPIIGQIFKASQDNINGISLTLGGNPTLTVDDFESYTSDGTLQAAWVATNAGKKAELHESPETPLPYEGDKCMYFKGDGDDDDEWERALDHVDLTGYTGSVAIRQNKTYNDMKLRFYVGDGSNTASAPLVVQDKDAWEVIEVSAAQLTEDGGGTTDITDIIEVGFRLEKDKNGGKFYIDDMKAAPEGGTVQLELWDMGTDIPVSGDTSLDDGDQYVELGDRGVNSGAVAAYITLDVQGGIRNYDIEKYIAGVALEIPGNTLLTPNNFYALILRYVDTDVNIYGANTSYSTNYYTNGYAFTAPNNATNITAIGPYNDIQFAIFSTQDVYVNTLLKYYDAEPGSNATESVYIEGPDMSIENILDQQSKPQQSLLAEFDDRSFYFPKGGKFEVNQNDDYTDDTSQITILIGYMFAPQETNN